MILKLDPYFTIDGNGNSFNLSYRKESEEINEKTGKPFVTDDIWYYSNFKHALRAYVDKCEISKDNSTLEEVLATYKQIITMINNLK